LIKLNKFIFVLIFILSGCIAGPSLYMEAFSSSRQLVTNKELVISEQIKKIPYAMKISRVGNSKEVLLVLVEARDQKLIWTSASKELITTYNGKIIKTIGLLNDIEIRYYPSLLEVAKKISLNKESDFKYKSLVSFSNPKALSMDAYHTYSFLKNEVVISRLNDRSIETFIIKEDLYIPLINFKSKNMYWVDNEFNVIKSQQKIVPNMQRIELTSLKKYSGK
tara:strand:- start:321 stop:986 length:666 start_codon:yes stop_codon:yes gene_type:complete